MLRVWGQALLSSFILKVSCHCSSRQPDTATVKCAEWTNTGFLVQDRNTPSTSRASKQAIWVRRESRFTDCLNSVSCDKTRCSTSGILPGHAVRVIRRCESSWDNEPTV